MIGELYINKKDAWFEWGVNMGNGFLDAIDGFVPMKDYIEYDSRVEHGKRMAVIAPRVASRSVTLKFTITGENEFDFRYKRKAFEQELMKGNVDIGVPALGNDVFHLVYTGNNVSYAMNQRRTFCTISAKFEEPNPTDRTERV